LLFALLILPFTFSASAKVYLNQGEFVSLVDSIPEMFNSENDWINKTLWLNKELQNKIIPILDQKYPKLRLRYKIKDCKERPIDSISIWFLEEIGKERPISFGVAIKNNQIELIKVLEFRESRGFEISIPAFAKQFENASLAQDGTLNKNIDGITGATMSVSAMKKISRVALMLHKHINIIPK